MKLSKPAADLVAHGRVRHAFMLSGGGTTHPDRCHDASNTGRHLGHAGRGRRGVPELMILPDQATMPRVAPKQRASRSLLHRVDEGLGVIACDLFKPNMLIAILE